MAKKQIVKQVYAYVICAICVGAGIIFLCVGIWGIVKITSPQFTLPQWEWKEIATFQSFKTDWERRETAPKLTDEELKVRWQDKKEIAVMGEKRGGWQNLTMMLICFAIVIPTFIIHWVLARKLHTEEQETTSDKTT